MRVSCSPMEDVKEMGTTLKLWRSAMRGVLVSNTLLVDEIWHLVNVAVHRPHECTIHQSVCSVCVTAIFLPQSLLLLQHHHHLQLPRLA